MKRIGLKFNDDKFEAIAKFAEELGMARSQLLYLAIVIGLEQLKRFHRPETMLDVKTLADVIQELNRRDMRLNDLVYDREKLKEETSKV